MANEEHLAILQQGVEVWNQWRKKNPGIRPDLSDSDLSHIYLRYIDLRNADTRNTALHHTDLWGANFNSSDLQNADMSDTDLGGVSFERANLHGTNLTDADISFASFYRTNLSGADFSGTVLNGTNFRNVEIDNAIFDDAIVSNTTFIDADLSAVRRLETVHHRGPSSIGIDTIYKSKGQIPEIFLRGCGVPEIFIEYMHALTTKPFEFYSCFISYSHADAAFAQRLHDTLQGKGVRCWLDEKDARLGVPITHNIESGIRLTDKFLLCCSKESLGSNWVNFEIDLALHRETELRKEGGEVWRIIPLDLDGHLFSSAYSGEGLRIKNRLAGDFTGWKTDSDKFDRQIARVMQAIRIESEGSVTK